MLYPPPQRPLHNEADASHVGADPSIEVLRTTVTVGSGVLRYVRTYGDTAVMLSPNDVVGAPDGRSFWFTNDGTHLRGLAVRVTPSSLQYCSC